MRRYWIGVASNEHVKKGIVGNFAQVCHGKQGPLKRMSEGDWIIYYSPTEKFGESEPCRKFTAIGKVLSDEPYLFPMSDSFIPWRRNVKFISSHEVAIEPLLDQLNFITNKQYWGLVFRRGFFEINPSDFELIASAMIFSKSTYSCR